jgi:ABC-2 type transport system permease protein
MAVYKRTYRAYDGPLTPAWSRFMVVARYSFSTLFKSRIFTAFTALSFIPVLVGIAQIYLVHNDTAKMLLNMRSGFGNIADIDNGWFATMLWIQAWMGFFQVAAAAPGMVTRDFANQALQLYLSRPVSRVEYLLGKITVLAALLSFATWIPGLVLFGMEAQLEGHGWGWNHLYLVGSIVLAGWMWIAVLSLFTMAISVWLKYRVAATALIISVFFLVPGFGVAVNAILRTRSGQIFDLPLMLNVAWAHLFRVSPEWLHGRLVNGVRMDTISLLTAWLVIVCVCAMSWLLLNGKLKAREVQRG